MKKEFLVLAALLAFCSIAYELLFANTLSILAGGTIWWHSFTIGIYVAGLGVGTFKAGRSLFPARDLVRIELALSVIGMSSAVAVYVASAIYETANSIALAGYVLDFGAYMRLHTALKILFFLVTQSLVFIVGLLSGYEVPLLIRLSGDEQKTNRLLAANYIGTLFGTLAFAYFLLPKLDVVYAAYVVGGLNLLASVYIMWRYLPIKTTGFKIGVAGASVWLVILIFIGAPFQQAFLQIYYRAGNAFIEGGQAGLGELWRKISADGDVTRTKSLYQYIDYFNVTWRGKEEFILMLDTNFQFSSKNEKSYHEAFAHIPMLSMQRIPKSVLILGAGDGLLARELLKYNEIERIKQVELDDEMVELARTHPVISKMNENALDNPRLELVIGDAFQYLRKTNEKFEAVFIDFPYPKNYNLSKLFSVEFYGFVRNVLEKDGFMVIDAPLRRKTEHKSHAPRQRIQIEMAFLPKDKITNSIIISTVYQAGFKKFMPYMVDNETFLLATVSDKEILFDLSDSTSPYFDRLDQSTLNQIGEQFFPFELEDRFVNSVFHPLLVE